MKDVILKISAIVLTLFAVLTLFMSTSVIFDLFGIQAKEGHYVLFIVMSNFVCGLLYLAAVYGLFKRRPWTTRLLLLSLIILILALIGLIFHIRGDGVYEAQTVKAMIFRISITLFLAGISWQYITRQSGTINSSK